MIRLSVVMPCYGRPQRTRRMIECVLAQDINGWELFLIGDNCPHYDEMFTSGYLADVTRRARINGNIIHTYNLQKNEGGHGYFIINTAIQQAGGNFFTFIANDDVILPDHFSNYLEIEKTSLDYMYFDSFIDITGQRRVTTLGNCQIGHSEIIVRTSLAKLIKPHTPKYGHDWDFIEELMQKGKGAKSTSKVTYHVMNVPNLGGNKDTID